MLLVGAASLLLLLTSGCARAPDGIEAGDAGNLDLEGDHAHYLQSVAGARLELVELGEDGGWREIRGGGQAVRLAAPPERIASRTLATDEILLEIAEPERIALLSPFADDPEFTSSAEAARQLGRVGGFSTEEILGGLARPGVRCRLQQSGGSRPVEVRRRTRDRPARSRKSGGHRGEHPRRRPSRSAGTARPVDWSTRCAPDSVRRGARAGDRVAGLRVINYSGGVVLGRRTVFDDAIRHLGAVNLAAENGLVGWPRIGAEQVVLWDPDVIFTYSTDPNGPRPECSR